MPHCGRQTAFERLVVPPLALQLEWGDGLLQGVRVGWSGSEAAEAPSTASGQAVTRCLEEYLQRGAVQWPDLPLAWESLPPFSRRVLQALKREVQAGRWAAYSDLAAWCGNPGAARAVGAAMRRNPWPLVVPCHRVLAKDRGLGGFSSGLALKRYLLLLEGLWPAPEASRVT